MWKVFLLLLALGVVFVLLLRFLERWSQRSKIEARRRSELPASRDDEAEVEEEGAAEAHFDALIEDLFAEDADRAREAAQKLLMIGPGVLGRLLPAFVRAERGRHGHELAVVARRIEDTLVAFGPAAMRPCLEALIAEKGSFEVFRGTRAVGKGIGEAAARSIVEALPRLTEEGLYARAVLCLAAIGRAASSPILRGIEGGEEHLRELCGDAWLDLAQVVPQVAEARFREAFAPGARRVGLMASPEVRLALLRARRSTGVAPGDEGALRAAAADEDPRVRREAWLAIADLPDAAASRGVATDADDSVAAAQVYALGAEVAGASGRASLARLSARARVGGSSALASLEAALCEGPVEVRREAAEGLARAGGDAAAQVLARGLTRAPVPLFADVAQALGRTRSSFALAPLCDLWEERGGNALRRAVAALGDLAVPRLTEYVARRSPHLMEPAAFVLGQIGDPARPPLLEVLRKSGPDDPALFAVEIAFLVQGAAGVEDALGLLESEEAHVVEVAVWVLSQSADPRAADPLLRALEDIEDRYPVLDYVREGPPEARAAALRFLDEHPDHPDAAALRQAAGG